MGPPLCGTEAFEVIFRIRFRPFGRMGGFLLDSLSRVFQKGIERMVNKHFLHSAPRF